MENKRPVGVIIFSILFVFFTIIELFNFLAGIVVGLYKNPSEPAPISFFIIFIATQIPKVIFLILSFLGLWFLKNWCRKMLLYLYPVLLIGCLILPGWFFWPVFPYAMPHSLIYIGLLFYLTRPRIKEQFK